MRLKVTAIHGESTVYLATESLIKTLFANDLNRLAEWVDRMIKKNNECCGITSYAFLYNGSVYRQSNVVGRIDAPRLMHVSLMDEMEAFLKDKAIIDEDQAYIRQSLVNLFDPCETLQDMRDTLPECLVICLPQLQPMARTRPAGFTIESNPRAMRQYLRILPKMEAYAAARLIF